jgi:hypothetical protein
LDQRCCCFNGSVGAGTAKNIFVATGCRDIVDLSVEYRFAIFNIRQNLFKMKIFGILIFLIYSAGVFWIGRVSKENSDFKTNTVRFVNRLIKNADGSTVAEQITEQILIVPSMAKKTPARSLTIIPNYDLRYKTANIAVQYAEMSKLPLIGEFETGVFVNIEPKNGTIENVGLSATKRF